MSFRATAGVTAFGGKRLWTGLAGSVFSLGTVLPAIRRTIVATFAGSRALVDFWIIWVLVDLVGVPLAIKSGLYVSGEAYGTLFVVVLAGFRSWIKKYRRQRRSAELEAVAA